jgi:uncharacterized membrane protein
MNLLTFKLVVLGIIIVLIGLYLHIIITNTKNNNNTTEKFGNGTDIIQPISIQLTDQISLKLNISIRRIQNLAFSGNLSNQSLNVSFTILEPNLIETANGEPNAQTAASTANNMFNRNNFIVKINNVNVRLNRTNEQENTSINDMSSYFNNTGLLDIMDYSQQKYIQVPNDLSLTRFYNLTLDKNYNVKPILE